MNRKIINFYGESMRPGEVDPEKKSFAKRIFDICANKIKLNIKLKELLKSKHE